MPQPLRLLIVEGNVRESREAYRSFRGLTPAEAYAAVVQAIVPAAVTDIALPADAGANLPDPSGLNGYDGVFLTGSALNVYDGGPAIARQIDLMRAVYRAGTPVFGSCWGLQIGAAAAGGTVRKNPRGREVGIARRITRTPAGAGHPMLDGRPDAWDAPCTHLDEVGILPGEVTVLAANTVSAVQAAEIRHDGGVFWGVQYHPEFTLGEVASIMRRRTGSLVAEGFAADAAAMTAIVDDLETLGAAPGRADLAWKYGLDAEVLDPVRRTTELRNFLSHRVLPEKSARGRA